MHADVFEASDLIKRFVNGNRSEIQKFLSTISDTKTNHAEQIKHSQKQDHEAWFVGLPSSFKTKEEVMARKSQDRIRGYFYKVKDDLLKSDVYRHNKIGRKIVDDILIVLKQCLTAVDYFSSLFDRKCEKKLKDINDDSDELDGRKNGETPKKKLKQSVREICDDLEVINDCCVSLCDDNGEFRCHGLWNEARCNYRDHLINPYASRENVILFQIWNLDHQIEISRTVIPSLLNNVRDIAENKAVCQKHGKRAKNVSVIRYFLELFTVKNLKLVHIVCHDKGSHLLQSYGMVICESCDEFKVLEKILACMKVWQKNQ